MTFHSYLYYHLGESIRPQRGRKCQESSQVLRFGRLMPKGEKVFSPKQKDRTSPKQKDSTTFSKKIKKKYFNWYLIKINLQLVCEVNFSISISLDISKLFFKLASSKLHIKYEISIGIILLHIYFKTLLKAKRRISLRGSLL
jgi:hypothetical protein